LSILEKVRHWIDGDSAEQVLEQAARDAQVKPRSKAEEFIVKIAREVESVMQAEMLPLPQGTTIIPSEYIIFLSSEDDKEWQGVKRKGLEQGLYHILAERAKELAGKKKLETRSFVIELRIDATLARGDVRVQHSWEDANANKTGVLARPKPASTPAKPAPVSPAGTGATDPNLRSSTSREIDQAVPLGAQDADEMTRVKTRNTELYRLEVWRGGVRQNVIPVFQKEVVVGRGSRSKPVDIPLSGDVEISRRHVTIITDGEGSFWAVNEGKNPATVNNYELPAGQKFAFQPGVPLNICSYMLRIQPNAAQ
jgi:hypothetical protein